MADGINFDFSQLNEFSADLHDAPEKSARNIRAAIVVSARNVKDTWAKKSSGNPFAPAFPYSITYDITGGLAIRAPEIRAEIGPDKDRRQGALGNLIEFGSINNAPRGYGLSALEATSEDFVRGLEKAVDDGLKDVGL